MSTIHLLRHATAISFIALAASAHAQRAAAVVDADAAIRVPYQEVASGNCQYAGVCVMTFSAVPAGRRRELQHASCYLYTSNVASSVEYVELSSTAPVPASRLFIPVSTYPGTSWSYTADASIMAFYEAGTVPRIQAFTSARMILFVCTLTGREIAL